MFWRRLAAAKRSGAHAFEALAPAFYVPPSPAKAKKWRDWLARWRRAGPYVNAMNQLVNPLFVPREWMLVERASPRIKSTPQLSSRPDVASPRRYEAAERGDNSVIETLQQLFVEAVQRRPRPRAGGQIRPPRARRRSYAGRRRLRHVYLIVVNRRATQKHRDPAADAGVTWWRTELSIRRDARPTLTWYMPANKSGHYTPLLAQNARAFAATGSAHPGSSNKSFSRSCRHNRTDASRCSV